MRVQFFQFQGGQRDCRQVEPVRQVRLVEHVVRVQFSNFKEGSMVLDRLHHFRHYRFVGVVVLHYYHSCKLILAIARQI